MDRRASECGWMDLVTSKFPISPPEIGPRTSRLVEHCVNQLHQSPPLTAILLCLILFLNTVAVLLLDASSVEICSIFRKIMVSLTNGLTVLIIIHKEFRFIIIIIFISFIWIIHSYVPETNHVPRGYTVAATLLLYC